MRQYELVAVFPPEEELFRQGKEAVVAELAKQGAADVKETDMGDRQLAYTIKKKDRGHYILFTMNLDPQKRHSRGEDVQAQPQSPQVSVRQGGGLREGRPMSDLAVAVIVGRLTRDAELKYTNSGQAVCHFSVATGSRRKKGDQWVEESSFWDVDLWGKQGESINQYLTKGKLVAVEGAMRQDKWEQDGQTRSKTLISANTVQLLGSSSSGGQGGCFEPRRPALREAPGSAAGPQSSAGARPSAGPPRGDDFTDDIPF